ncbi:uncharacterized protein FIBRA_05662 [Fibroporia radiculosa]|uniref:SP-RING-type domain-containing protein n=1 Tax=Fibroporia radiculosa TaxID=599839 RepID=J4G9W5_9APHY|nr:uncharacterized protein FIBRA_05662 [Fibroporia radiculosa]CCM03528.1 predicted protein [Fibroporia radiculosa]
MAVAGSSRRVLRRQPSSDGIEEDMSQRVDEDVVDEDAAPDKDRNEKQPRRTSRSVKKEGKKKAEGHEDAGADDSIEIMENQPLDKAAAQKLNGLASDWDMMRRKNHAPYYGLVRDVATVFAEFAEGEKSKQVLGELDAVVRELLDTENELLAHDKVLKDLNQRVTQQEQITNVVERYKGEAARELKEYNQKTSRQKYVKVEEYVNFRQAIFEVQYPETAMPPVSDFLPKEDGDASDDDDDVQVGGVTQDYKCPLTLTILVNPLTSKLCGHSFSADAIREYLGPSHTVRKDCPASGCKKGICLTDLEPNKELAKKAKDAARRERMREDDSEVEEDVVE